MEKIASPRWARGAQGQSRRQTSLSRPSVRYLAQRTITQTESLPSCSSRDSIRIELRRVHKSLAAAKNISILSTPVSKKKGIQANLENRSRLKIHCHSDQGRACRHARLQKNALIPEIPLKRAKLITCINTFTGNSPYTRRARRCETTCKIKTAFGFVLSCTSGSIQRLYTKWECSVRVSGRL